MPHVLFVASSFSPLRHFSCLHVTAAVCVWEQEISAHASTSDHVVALNQSQCDRKERAFFSNLLLSSCNRDPSMIS